MKNIIFDMDGVSLLIMYTTRLKSLKGCDLICLE